MDIGITYKERAGSYTKREKRTKHWKQAEQKTKKQRAKETQHGGYIASSAINWKTSCVHEDYDGLQATLFYYASSEERR